MNRIHDYALIGDCHSAALVGRDGSIDWACFPRFDSPSAFARVLDERAGGSFSVAPLRGREVRRRYIEDTNVLVTETSAEGGVVEVTDCMPVASDDPSDPARLQSFHSILRRVRCTAGDVEVVVRVAPRFEYGRVLPRFRLTSPATATIAGGADALWVRATHPLEAREDAIVARWTLAAGEEAWIEAAWTSSHGDEPFGARGARADMTQRLDDTIAFWERWAMRCAYEGENAEAVRRSALVLKALTYAPTGAVIAAPTTSLPEEIGGGRNWDYRYTWIRDGTLTLIALFTLGFFEEANAFKRWLERTGAGRAEDLQIMYGVAGERFLPELELAHLSGHRGSAPVRIGNAAATQLQLDAYGQLLEAASLLVRAGGDVTEENWRFLSGLAELACIRWRAPDHGIWEMRDEPRHFVHSKVNCWVALDRAVKIAEWCGLPADLKTWRRERDALRAYLMEDAAAPGWFPQATGHLEADAATLLVPSYGLLPTTHPVSMATIDHVRRRLERDGLVYRYLSPDGLEGGEGAFLICSFWLVDALAHAGRTAEAEEVLNGLLAHRNDVGLYAEEIDPVTGEGLGNFPQAFPHMALVMSSSHLTAAKEGLIPDAAVDYAELAVDRLLARMGGIPVVPRR